MIDLGRQYNSLKSDYEFAFRDVMSSGHYIGGSHVKAIEYQIGQYLSIEHVISCANGTDALTIALLALDLDHGDEVIIPAFNYVSAAESCALLGLIPRFMDVDKVYFNLDAESLEDVINSHTRCIVVSHLFGQMADMDTIMDVARRHGLYVIEDFAQSFGAFCDNESNDERQYSGTLGHIGCCSFFPTKNLWCFGDGGMLCTKYKHLADKIRSIANHGQIHTKFYHEIVGMNSRLDALQAAFLVVNLKHLDSRLAQKRQLAKLYYDRLNGLEHIATPAVAVPNFHTFHQYVIREKSQRRDKLVVHLKNQGIESKVYYPVPLHQQIAYKAYYSPDQSLAVSEGICKEVLALPIHDLLSTSDVHYVCDQIHNFYE